jgi:hypothetical protein
MKFPNFILIGANKGGTPSFSNYLSHHPEIFMSDIKEPMFFFYNDMSGAEPVVKLDPNEPKWKNWRPVTILDDYVDLFADMPPGVKAAGEASTAYLANPFCAERIARFNPAMKIIAILREPVSRAFSSYLMYVRLGHEKDSFSNVVEKELSGNKSDLPQGQQYLRLGYYADSISEYQRVFGKENVKIYLNEELKNHPQELFYDVFHFLGLDTSFQPGRKGKIQRQRKCAYPRHDAEPYLRRRRQIRSLKTVSFFCSSMIPFVVDLVFCSLSTMPVSFSTLPLSARTSAVSSPMALKISSMPLTALLPPASVLTVS